jgi:hypothetical protein
MIDERIIRAVEGRRKRHGNTVVTLDLLESILREAVSPVDYAYRIPAPPMQLTVAAEFPKLRVRCDSTGQVVEQRILHSREEEAELRKQATQNHESWFHQPLEKAVAP